MNKGQWLGLGGGVNETAPEGSEDCGELLEGGSSGQQHGHRVPGINWVPPLQGRRMWEGEEERLNVEDHLGAVIGF